MSDKRRTVGSVKIARVFIVECGEEPFLVRLSSLTAWLSVAAKSAWKPDGTALRCSTKPARKCCSVTWRNWSDLNARMTERLELQQFLDSLFKEVYIHGLFFVSLLESASDIAIAIYQNDVGDVEFGCLWRHARNVVEYH